MDNKQSFVLGFVKQAMATGMTAGQAFEFYKVAAGGLGYNPTAGADLRQQAMDSGNMVENTPMTTNNQNPIEDLDFANKSPEGPLAMPQDFSQDPEIMRYIQHLTGSDSPLHGDPAFDNIINSKGVRDPLDNYVAGNSDDLSGSLSGLNDAFSGMGKAPNPGFSPSVANEAMSNVFNQAGNGMRGKLLSDLNLPVPNASISNQVSQPWR